MAAVQTEAGRRVVGAPGPRSLPSPSAAVPLPLCGVLGSAVLVGTALLAVWHVDDLYRTDHVSGARAALAQHAADGTLFPPLHEDGRYGGTRFMPLPVLLHGGLARLTGEQLVSGRLLALGASAGVLALVVVVLVRRGCPRPVVLALAALTVGTAAGLSALMGMRADAVALLLSLGAVVLVAERPGRRGLVLAGLLCAAALLAKATAVWAPLAVAVWLLRRRAQLGTFLLSYATAATLLLGGVELATDGRLSDNVLGLAGAGSDGAAGLLTAPYRVLRVLVDDAPSLLLLLLLAAWALWRARRSWSLYDLSLLAAAAVLVVVFSDRGVGSNQLVDVAAMSALVVGARTSGPWVPAVLPVVLAVGLVLSLALTVGPDLRRAAGGTPELSAGLLDGLVGPDTPVLSEDPYVPVRAGQRPVVLDPFMLRALGERDPAALDPLVADIAAGRFAYVVLVEPLEPVDRWWWREVHLGPRVAAAIAERYELGRTVGRYLVHVPRDGAPGGPS